MSPWRAAALAVLVLIAGCATLPGAAPGATQRGPSTSSCSLSPVDGDGPPDPETDVLGWEGGRWYNGTLEVDAADGLNCAELSAIVARAMARVERIRDLEFENPVPVEVIGREEFRERATSRDPALPRRRFENAKFEALFMIDEATDAVAVRGQNAAGSIAAFYRPGEDTITIITANPAAPRLPEPILGHELLHALQDQVLPSAYRTADTPYRSGITGLIEGDANLVEHYYERRCAGPWNGTCFPQRPPPDDGGGGGGGGGLANIGPFLISFQPYSDGPSFVERIRERGGWAAVNDLYAAPPASSEQLIHPEKYPGDGPTVVTVPDRSGPGWDPIGFGDRPLSHSFGEDGVFAMFLYPAFDDGVPDLIPRSSFFTRGGGDGVPDPYNYSHPYSAGWDGDEFVAYANGTGALGYVWALVWDSPAEAREFVAGYERLLRAHGAERVDGRRGTWRIPEGNAFADAFYVERRGNRVVIVNAPRVAALDDIREGAAPGA